MKRAPYTPTDADLRAAHAASGLAYLPFERVMASTAHAIVIRNFAEARARRVPQRPEHFQLTP